MLAAVVILFFVAIIITVLVVLIRVRLKEIDVQSSGAVVDPNQVRTAQEFLPFDKIEDNIIDLGGFRYRKIIECSSINYQLKTDMEKEMIEASFSRFLNSFQFPITIFIQTREMNLTNYLENLKDSINETVEEFPLLKTYAEQFYLDMITLPEKTGNSKQKKKYIIVGYDDAAYLETLNAEEKREEAINELNLRVSSLIDNLSGLGIKASELSTAGLLELIYSTYHKDDYSNFENLLNGEYTTLITGLNIQRDENTGRLVPYINRNKVSEMTDSMRAQNALWNAKNMILNEVLAKDGLDEDSKEIYQAVIDRIDEISEQVQEITGGVSNV